MDIEIHYYVNFLLAMKAGFNPNYAFKIAYSRQYIDDNSNIYKIYNYLDCNEYRNIITQTHNINLPNSILDSIYPVFHFVPGKSKCKSQCKELDHPLVARPKNQRVTSALSYALSLNNPYIIGIASHAFLDSWAHQNFTGTFDIFNSIYPAYNAENNILNSVLIPKVGHMDALGKPDMINAIWFDYRVINSKIDNNDRFLEAIQSLLLEYIRSFNKNIYRALNKDEMIFIDDIKAIFLNNELDKTKRIKAYNSLSLKHFNLKILRYNKNQWFDDIIFEKTNYILDIKNHQKNQNYFWKKPFYQKSDFYLFQEAAKDFQKFVLDKTGLKKVLDDYRNK